MKLMTQPLRKATLAVFVACTLAGTSAPVWADSTTAAVANAPMLAQHVDIRKSPNDKREYAYTVLPNGFKLLVISDPEATKAAVSVDVAVGSGNEPKQFPGLAHFLEHMLFLGTDKYPSPDEFMSYISANGGSNNAYTAFDHTNYYFDVNPKDLKGALSRFSRFFVAPLMLKDYVNRERHAVDSEYRAKIRAYGWRAFDVYKQGINPNHPYARFNVGSLETLPQASVRPALLKFYKAYYSADRMSAVIVGRQSTKILQQWGEAYFKDVPNHKNAASTEINEKLFAGQKLPLLLENHSLRQEKNMMVSVVYPYDLADKYHKVWTYLAYNFNYPGKNGLVDTLKKAGYITELGAGVGEKIGSEVPFEVNLQLTDKGLKHYQNVTALIFAYAKRLLDDPNGAVRYKELATEAATDFRFEEKGDAIDETSELATRLNRYPAQDILALGAIYAGFDQQKVTKILQKFRPENALIQITAPEIKGNKRTKYFDVSYRTSHPTAQSLSTLQGSDATLAAQMQLPDENPFVATDLSLTNVPADNATLNEKLANGVELFYHHNTEFSVPRSVTNIALQPAMSLTVKEKVAMKLLAKILNEQLSTEFYQGSVAGLSASFLPTETYLKLDLSGYQQKMPIMVNTMLQKLQHFNVTPELFAREKKTYVESLQNVATQMPYRQAFTHLGNTLLKNPTIVERLTALQALSLNDLTQVHKALLAKMAVRMLVYGNNTPEQARALSDELAKTLTQTNLQAKWRYPTVYQIKKDEQNVFDVKHQDNATVLYLQGQTGIEALANAKLLAKMMSSPFFNSLRTEKQLGYIVFATNYPVNRQAGIVFAVESPTADLAKISAEITAFNKQFAKDLNNLGANKFMTFKKALITELRQPAQNLNEAAGYYWGDIVATGQTTSERLALADALQNLKRETFIENARKFLLEGKWLKEEAKASLAKPATPK